MAGSWQPVSNRDLFRGVALLALIVVATHFKNSYRKASESEGFSQSRYEQQGLLPSQLDHAEPKKGVMVTLREGKEVTMPRQAMGRDRLHISTFGGDHIGIMAQATDHRHYFANGYLLGFIPFSVENVYNAMNFIAARLRYQLDEKQFRGYKEMWQTSKEAYVRMRGDCEDHAILLADWLQSLGFDARVAVGRFKGEGHAWVVWFNRGEAFIIEATSKRQRRFYPLATMLPDYRASYMFDREGFWQKKRHTALEDYKTGWQKTAYFKPF